MTTKVKQQLLVGVLQLLLFALAGCQSDEKQALDYLENAKQLYNDGKYSLASVEIKNAIRKDSTLAEPYLLQAKIFEKKKEWEAMHAFLATTLQQQPKHIEANIEIAKLYAKGRNIIAAQRHLDIAIKAGAKPFSQHLLQGMIYMNSQKLDDAVEQANAALAIDPTSVDATILLSSLFIHQKKFQQAINITDEALEKHPESDTLILIKSRIYSMQGDFTSAAKHAQQLTTLFPKELSYHYLLAALYDRAGDSKAAENALRQATEANPDSSKAKIALAGYISQQNKTLAAIDLLSLYIESQPDTGNEELRLILAELYQKEGMIQRATDTYKALTDNDNTFSLTAKNKLALIALKDNRQSDAFELLNEVLQSDFSNTEALVTRSIIHMADRRTDQAITDLLSAIREDPKSELALMLLSQAYKQNNNQKLESQTLVKLLKLNPAHQEAALQYSQILYKQKNYKAAIESLKSHIEHAGPSNIVRHSLMNAYLADKDWAQARALAQVIAIDSKQPAYVDFTNAMILQLTNQHGKSTRMLSALIGKNLFVHQSLKAIAFNYREQGQIEKGLRYIERYAASHPNDLFVVNLLVTEYSREQQFDQAEEKLKEALAYNKDWHNGHLQLAKLYAAQAKWENAISSGLAALSDDESKNSIDTLLLLASSYEHADNAEQAEIFYRRVLKRAPNILSAANNLALILAENDNNQQRIDEAFQIARRFEQTNQPLFIDTLGWIEFLRGNYRQAVILLEKAVFGAPEEAVIHYHLGATLIKLSELDKARKHLQKSLELGAKQTSFKEHDKAKALLDTLT